VLAEKRRELVYDYKYQRELKAERAKEEQSASLVLESSSAAVGRRAPVELSGQSRHGQWGSKFRIGFQGQRSFRPSFSSRLQQTCPCITDKWRLSKASASGWIIATSSCGESGEIMENVQGFQSGYSNLYVH
jgi:hypothetical protein